MSVPDDLRYTQDHEWVRPEADGTLTIGITDYAQGSLGDVTYVELPEVGRKFGPGEVFGVVESVKAASDLYVPVAGEITAANADLANAPEQVNQDPYGAAWMIRIKPDDPAAVNGLMDATAYRALI